MSNLKVEIQKNENSNRVPLISLPENMPPQGLINPQLIKIAEDFFNDNGVLQIDNLYDKEFVAQLSQSFQNSYSSYFDCGEYADSLEVGDKRRMITIDVKEQFNNPQLYANPFLFSLMQKVLGNNFILGSYGVVVALPGAEHQHVHRDHPSLFDDELIDAQIPSFAVTAVIPLVDLTEATGSTRVWKQSHNKPRSQREYKLNASDVPYMETGSCYLMDYQLVHGGTANVSDIVRPILYLIYYRPWFREVINFEKQDRINITLEEYQKIPEQYKFLFTDLSISDRDRQKIDLRETATPLLSDAKFEELDNFNQEHRLALLAKSILPAYGLEDYRLKPISHRENTTFRLDLPGGVIKTEPNTPYIANRYLLRIHRGNYLSPNAVQSELQWLQALRRDLNFPVPEPVANKQGQIVTVKSGFDIPGQRVCSITRWVHAETNQPMSIKAMGTAIARLHNHGKNWQLPANFERPRWDWDGLFGAGAGYSINRGDEIWQLTPQPYRDLFRRVGDRFKQVEQILGTGTDQFGLIHGDLCPANLLMANNEVRPIDFADCGYGYWVHDLAMFLSYYARDPQVPTYLRSLIQGYGEVRPAPMEQLKYIDTFIATQHVTLALWRLNRSQDHPYFRSIIIEALEEAAQHAKWYLDNCPDPAAI